MSVKDVERYYSQVCDQYSEMMDLLREFESAHAEDMISPERIEQLKLQIEPIKRTYEQFSYWMFLLHQPQRKSKVARYKQQNQRLLKNLDGNNSLQSILDNNAETLDKVGN